MPEARSSSAKASDTRSAPRPSSFSRTVTRPNNFTGEDEELLYSGQELAFLISATDESEWCFMDAWLRDDPATTVGNAKRVKDNSNNGKPVTSPFRTWSPTLPSPKCPMSLPSSQKPIPRLLSRLSESRLAA